MSKLLAKRYFESIIVSTIVGLCFSVALVALFFGRTRGDGVAVLQIAFFSAGVAVNPSIFSFAARRDHVRAVWAYATVIPWLALALFNTLSVCKGAFITGSNWWWIWSSGDGRGYELLWIIKGWASIVFSSSVGMLSAKSIHRRYMQTSVGSS